jgi:CDP-diacylglycerol--serine O-phosphatidyltransferase
VRCIVFGGVCDLFDGAVARATGTGSQLGEQLDSLVDAISFGLAPAMIVYYGVLPQQGWGWLPVFMYVASAVFRLARFNVTQAGASKTYFIGLPSPAAGGTLATYYWFSQTRLYQDTRIVDLPWQEIMPGLMLLLAAMMSSTVPFPSWPKVGVRSWRGVAGLVGRARHRRRRHPVHQVLLLPLRHRLRGLRSRPRAAPRPVRRAVRGTAPAPRYRLRLSGRGVRHAVGHARRRRGGWWRGVRARGRRERGGGGGAAPSLRTPPPAPPHRRARPPRPSTDAPPRESAD